MKLIRPKYEIWEHYQNIGETTWTDPLGHIERCGRVCYQSEEKGDPEKFIRMIVKRGHESVLEHAWFAVQGYGSGYPTPPFMVKEESGLLLGNARAWRDAVRKGKVGLPARLKQICPVLFEDLPQRTDTLLKLVPLPKDFVLTVNFVVDRGVSHELVRHRPPSFSQESTRFCNYGKGVTFIIPPWLPDVKEGEQDTSDLSWKNPAYEWMTAMEDAEMAYMSLLSQGWTAQQARSVLPNSTKTQIVITAHWMEWQIILALRTDTAAHPQMQEVMVPLASDLAVRNQDKFGPAVIEEVRKDILNRLKRT